jgi:hypothetical protein
MVYEACDGSVETKNDSQGNCEPQKAPRCQSNELAVSIKLCCKYIIDIEIVEWDGSA